MFKYAFIFTFFFALSINCLRFSKTNLCQLNGQKVDSIVRLADETAAQFVQRLHVKNGHLAHPIIQSTWNKSPVIVAFTEELYTLPIKADPDQTKYTKINGWLYQEIKPLIYHKLSIDTYDNDGGAPHIEAVFFANADQDAQKECVIIVSWEQKHFGATGNLFSTFVYDDVKEVKDNKLVYLPQVSEKISGDFDGEQEGKKVTARFKTAKSIRNELIRLGFKQ